MLFDEILKQGEVSWSRILEVAANNIEVVGVS
jgi:hypothetical protein